MASLTALLASLALSGPAFAAPLAMSHLAPPAPVTVFSAVSCLAALLSCGFSLTLWRRVDSGQEAAKASMYAAGKLFDTAARRFARAQDDAASAIDAATSAASQAGQAAARLAAAVRDTEARLSACVGESEARLHAAISIVSRLEKEAAAMPEQVSEALDRIGAGAVSAIDEAGSALRDSAASSAERLHLELQTVPGLIAQAIAAVDTRAASRVEEAARALQDRIASITGAAAAVPEAAAALNEAAASAAATQARHAALIERVEALAGVLPSIATSLASTAAGQRQLLSQGRAGVESGLQEMRHAASSLSASVDEAASCLRLAAQSPLAPPARLTAAPPMHPALRPRDLAAPRRGEPSPSARREAGEDVV